MAEKKLILLHKSLLIIVIEEKKKLLVICILGSKTVKETPRIICIFYMPSKKESLFLVTV